MYQVLDIICVVRVLGQKLSLRLFFLCKLQKVILSIYNYMEKGSNKHKRT